MAAKTRRKTAGIVVLRQSFPTRYWVLSRSDQLPNFAHEPLDTRNSVIAADVAVWVKIDTPSSVTTCRLFLRYFAGTGFRDIELDHLNHALGTPALLSARAKLPIELQQMTFSVCVEIKGSEYKVDTVHFLLLLEKKSPPKNRPLKAA